MTHDYCRLRQALNFASKYRLGIRFCSPRGRPQIPEKAINRPHNHVSDGSLRPPCLGGRGNWPTLPSMPSRFSVARLRQLNRSQGCLLLIGVVALVLLCCVLLHQPILAGLARGWIVSTPIPEHVEAVAIPGGGLETRPFEAARMYQERMTERLVVFESMESKTQELEIIPAHHELILELLGKLEIPEDAIALIGEDVTSTFDEAETLKDWAEANGIKDVVVITEIFPSRRVRWIYQKTFRNSGCTAHILTCAPSSYSAENWWKDESGLIQFQNEVIKYFYYLAKY